MRKKGLIWAAAIVLVAALIVAGIILIPKLGNKSEGGGTSTSTVSTVTTSNDATVSTETSVSDSDSKDETTFIVYPMNITPEAAGQCNHTYHYTADHWGEPYCACTKCGYSVFDNELNRDCSRDGHLMIYGVTSCSICDEYVDYFYDYDENSFTVIDYHPATDECDGVAQLAPKNGNYILVAFIPAGHNHENEPVKNRFGTYSYRVTSSDLCFDGMLAINNCEYCGEEIGEEYVLYAGAGYHLSPVLVKTADSDDPEGIALMHCDACEKDFEMVMPIELVLSGEKKDVITTTKYSYIDGEDYLILLDKDIKLPGDFANNVGDIITEVRKVTNLLTDSWTVETSTFGTRTIGSALAGYTGANYWSTLPDNNRIIINMAVDREPAGYISYADASEAIFVEYEFFGDEFWNSVPDFRDNPWRRSSEPDYGVIIHEITHAVTLRTTGSLKLGSILTEGIAQYATYEVNRQFLVDKRPGYVDSRYISYDQTNIEINPENAEALFRNDYSDLSHAERGAEYDYGRYFCEFLDTSYGPVYFSKICEALNASSWSDEFGTPTAADRDNRTEIIKNLFGEDVFVKFGEWFQAR